MVTLLLSGCSFKWKRDAPVEPMTPPPVQEETAPAAAPEPMPDVSAPVAPTPEPAPPLPPREPITFEDETPLTAPPAPLQVETYEVLAPEGAYVFVPRELTIYAGDTVVWKNHSGIVHLFATIPGSDSSGAMEIEPVDLLVAGEISHTFNTPGTFPYFCFIHNRMTGRVVVLPR